MHEKELNFTLLEMSSVVVPFRGLKSVKLTIHIYIRLTKLKETTTGKT